MREKSLPLCQSQQHSSLRGRRNLTPASNVCEAAPVSLFWAPKRAQEITRNAIRISLQPDWQLNRQWLFLHANDGVYSNPSTQVGPRTGISVLFRRQT